MCLTAWHTNDTLQIDNFALNLAYKPNIWQTSENVLGTLSMRKPAEKSSCEKKFFWADFERFS